MELLMKKLYNKKNRWLHNFLSIDEIEMIDIIILFFCGDVSDSSCARMGDQHELKKIVDELFKYWFY